MNVTIEQLLMLIGGKEVDILLLKKRVAELDAESADLRKRLSEAEAKLGALAQ